MLNEFAVDRTVCSAEDFKKQTLSPTCTGTSVLGIKFKDGVILAADMLVSYGSLARYMNFERLCKVNDSTILACSGDMADFQLIKRHIFEQTHTEQLLADGFRLRYSNRLSSRVFP